MSVFHEDGPPLGDLRKTWANACKAAGVPGLLFHDFRRSAVRNLTRAGVPSVVAMQVTGHRTRAVFDRYDITTTDEAREAIRSTVKFLRARMRDLLRNGYGLSEVRADYGEAWQRNLLD